MNSRIQHYIGLITILTQKEMKVRYKNSFLGYVWSILNPLAFAFIFFVIFKIVMRIQMENYPLFLITGLFPWQWLSNSVNASPLVFLLNATRFGELKIDGDCVETFSEKPPNGDGLIKGGFFVFNRKILDYLTTDDLCDLEIGPLEQIAKEGQLMVYKHRGFWACMDTLRDMEYLNKIWNDGKAKWKIWK